MSDHTAWNPGSLAEVYARMVAAGADFVIIGGQAVNLWAEHYRQGGVLPAGLWVELLPFASDDLDCLGGSLDALAVGRDFGVRPRVYDPFGKAWTPSVADLQLPVSTFPGRTLLVQFLHTAKGLNSNEVESTARTLTWAGVTLRVLHPMLCLEGKLANLWELDQDRPPRQDLKHARLCCLTLHAFLRERLAAGQVREVLGLSERLLRLAGRQDGLKTWHRHGLAIEDAVPLDALRAAAGAGEAKAVNFLALRWDQLETMLAQRRGHFADLLRRQGQEPQPRRSPFVGPPPGEPPVEKRFRLSEGKKPSSPSGRGYGK